MAVLLYSCNSDRTTTLVHSPPSSSSSYPRSRIPAEYASAVEPTAQPAMTQRHVRYNLTAEQLPCLALVSASRSPPSVRATRCKKHTHTRAYLDSCAIIALLCIRTYPAQHQMYHEMPRSICCVCAWSGGVAPISYELHRRQYKDNYDHRWQPILAIFLAFFRVHLRHRPYLVPGFSSAGKP